MTGIVGEAAEHRTAAGPGPSRRPRRARRAVLAVVFLVVLGAAAAFSVSHPRQVQGSAMPDPNSDELAISQLVQDSALAFQNQDVDTLKSLMCPDEAQEFDDTYIPDPDAPKPDPVSEIPPLRVANVQVYDDVASAEVSTDDGLGAQPMYFQKVDGRWLVCADAEFLIPDDAAPTAPTGSPATPTD